jgi:hypothetical protein
MGDMEHAKAKNSISILKKKYVEKNIIGFPSDEEPLKNLEVV